MTRQCDLRSPTRRTLVQFFAATAVCASPLAARAAAKPAGIDMLEAINQAGRQRMLSQRLAKLYAQLLREVRGDEARKLTADSMALFERQLGNLHEFAQAKNASDIVKTYDQLRALWLDYRSVVGTPPNGDGLRAVAQLNEKVLVTANAGTVQLEKLAGGSLGKLVNISGRQRMLSQRIAKFYFFRSCGLNTPDITQGLEAARNEFEQNMRTLKAAPETGKEISSWLALGDTQWMFFDEAVRATGDSHDDKLYHENNVAVTSENLLQVMDKTANLYAAIKPA